MGGQPTLTTPRLVLRPFTAADAPVLQRLVGDRAVASTTLNIPHPYPDGAAEGFITAQAEAFASGTGATFAVTDRANGELLGAVGITITARFRHAELGYWIAAGRWNRGHATEAAAAVLDYAFGDLGLHRVYARYFPRNAASGRVVQKLGMTHEGRLRGHALKDGVFEDLEVWGILREEWRSGSRGA